MAVTHITPTRSGAAESPINLLDTNGAAAALGVSRRTIQQLASERKLAFIRFGRNVRFSHSDLAAFAEANRVKAIGWKGGRQ
jgi:excisionase family DNA binding protein